VREVPLKTPFHPEKSCLVESPRNEVYGRISQKRRFWSNLPETPLLLLEPPSYLQRVWVGFGLLFRFGARLGGGLVFEAHGLVYRSTLGLRVTKKKEDWEDGKTGTGA